MPAEWEWHAATWLAWPHKLESWPGKFEPIPPLYARLDSHAGAVRACECSGRRRGSDGASEIAGGRRAERHAARYSDERRLDARSRPDVSGRPARSPPALVDWGYNAWGGKYPPFDLDDAVPGRIAKWSGRRRFTPGIILEGGAIDSNGRGTILTTEQCLLNPNRNPQLDRADMERYLADYLGANKVLWLGEGIEGDDTDGHIDELARFVGPRTVVAALEDDPADTNYKPLRENFERLKKMTDQDDRSLEVIPLPMPRRDSSRRPASAGQLLQFLHGQWRGDRAAIRRSGRQPRDRNSRQADCRTAKSSACPRAIWCGVWALSTASRSRNRRLRSLRLAINTPPSGVSTQAAGSGTADRQSRICGFD